jgi:hypothetical protein
LFFWSPFEFVWVASRITGSSVGSLSRFVVLARDAAIVTVVTFGGGSVTIVFTPRRAR